MGVCALLSWLFQQKVPTSQMISISEISIEQSQLADLVETNVRFTRANIKNQNTLLAEVYVQPHLDVNKSNEFIRKSLTQNIQDQLIQQQFEATPLVNIAVLEPPILKN